MPRDAATNRVLPHQSASPATQDKLTARGVHWEFEPNLDISRIRDVEGNQVRLSEHRAPKETVQRYTEQMKAGAVFPAIVVNERCEIVDGNSRWMAARCNKRATVAAYVCFGISALEARSLSVELNQSHGLSMTEEELRAFVTSAAEEGQTLDARSYSRMTGVKPATLARWLAVKHFEMRAASCGIPLEQWGGLSDGVRAALHVAKLTSVFEHVTALACDARLPASELKPIVTQANAASSESEALSVITRARAGRAEQIRAIAAGFKTTKRASAGVALHLGGLMRFQVADMLDVAPEKRPQMYSKMEQLLQRLDEALTRARQEWSVESATMAPAVTSRDERAENTAKVSTT